jgi:hypothetical protein
MRNAFIFSVLFLFIASIFSCSKEISIAPRNAILKKWKIKSVIIDSTLGSITFTPDTLKRERDSLDLGTIEFIEGAQANSGTWVERLIVDTFRKRNLDTGYRISSGTFLIASKKLYRFLSSSGDTLEITRNQADTLVLTKKSPQDSLKQRLIKINCVKF